jgi:FKBP-type peptidyl-prolyl cis-trans isomerase SlyD
MRVGPNTMAVIDYRLYSEEGELLESSSEDNPLCFVFGEERIIPGLERELAGMEPGESKEITVSPEDGYGVRDPSLVMKVPRDRFPSDFQFEEGVSYSARTEEGMLIRFQVLQQGADFVEIDMNHPLAGKTLRFEVRVREVRDLGGTQDSPSQPTT